MRANRRRRSLAWLAGAAVATVVAAAGIAFAAPSIAASTCPGCYGLARLRSDRYVERGLSVERRQQVVDVLEEADARIRAFYGGRESSPRVLACVTDKCYERIGGGGERGKAIRAHAVMLSPRGIDAVIASHELSHIELEQRLGSQAGGVPRWFDEGLAAVVSDDLRYLQPAGAGDRCRVVPDGVLPETRAEWLAARPDDRLYAKAACRVSRWLDANGGRQALLGLVDRMSRGESFAEIAGR